MLDKCKLLVEENLNYEVVSDSYDDIFKRLKRNYFRLYNSEQNHFLELYNSVDGTIITGSLRKWYFGSDSLQDLSAVTLLKVCERISEITGLSMQAILDSKVLIMEFGMLFRLPILPATILRSIYGPTTHAELARFDTSISFRANDCWLNAYDKTIEINKIKRRRGEAEIADGENALRIELRAFRRTAFINKLRGVETLLDVFRCYRMLIVSFLYEIERMEMSAINLTTDNVNFVGMKASEFHDYLRYAGLEAKDTRRMFLAIRQLGISNRAKTYHRKILRRIVASYSSKSDYSKADFIRVIKKQLAKKISEPIPLL